MPTVYIECTTTYETRLNTGIQRVVRSVLRNSQSIAARHNYTVQPVLLQGREFLEVGFEEIVSEKQPARAFGPEAAGKDGYRARIQYLLKTLALESLRWLVIFLPFDPVRRLAYSPAIRRRLKRLLKPLSAIMGVRPPAARPTKPVEARKGDILLLLDAFWTLPNPWSAARKFQQRGGRVAVAVYDLIPLDYPEACTPEHVAVFKQWFKKLAGVADAFICNSNSVADRLSRYLKQQPTTSRAPISYFYLGSELDFIGDEAAIRPPFKAPFLTGEPVFIVVGSIEPRKNHAFILDAFEQLWRNGEKASLVAIGRPGWQSDSIISRIEKHPELGRRLFLVRDANDTELDYAYRNASALIIASRIEGFGLPVVEAFQHGLPVLCSDIPVFREIAEGKARFFELDDPSHLAEAVNDFMSAGALPRVVQPWLTWRESTEQLLSALTKLFPPAP